MKILIKNIRSLDTSCLLTNAKPNYLDDSRWEKLQSLKIETDKLRSLTSGYLLHKMCENLKIENSQYSYGKNGKPYINGFENVAFNLSHSGEYAVLAYSEIGSEKTSVNLSAESSSLYAIGVDIQQIRTLRERMQERILHENEQVPEGLSPEEETLFLNRIWCIKESYVKMTGDGLALDFRKIFIDFEKKRVSADNRPQAVFAEYNDLQGYVMAVCSLEPCDIQITEI